MKALIDVTNQSVLTYTESTDFGGPWGSMLKDGRAKLIDVPPGEMTEDVILVGGAVVVDTAKKSARLAKEQARRDRKERLKNHDAPGANSIAALRVIVADLLAELKGE
jgi:hypothetical protein